MIDPIYRELMNAFARKGGIYPGMDIPEFYAMASELFTPEEAAVAVAMPKGFFQVEELARILDKSEEETASILDAMARRGLCASRGVGESEVHFLPPFVPGIFEHQFMRGTRTPRDLEIARLIHSFKRAVEARRGEIEISFPGARVIAVDEKVDAGSVIHTYDQMSAYVESSDPISVCTCYCRHEAELLDENDSCGKPNEVCMQLGPGARFAIDKGLGREISKGEAMEILRKSEEEGLVHCSVNQQDIDFVCNCCADHCIILKTALAQPKPGLALNSGFEPRITQEECNACELCIEGCPATALALSEDETLLLDLDRCFGCGLCARSCPTEAIDLVEKPGRPEPPADYGALLQALRAAERAS
jgi:Pyruvate/2-oxoacid:ferredoxin oxidoreductase delta subunit